MELRSESLSSIASAADASKLAAHHLIDVHHHVILPEYEAALARSGALDPSRPFRKGDPPAIVCEKMNEIGVAAAVVNPLSVAGVHHGDDANARHLARSVGEALARFTHARPGELGFFAPLPLPDIDGALAAMAHAFDELKADGIILLSHQNGVYVGDPRYRPVYEEMNRRTAIVFIHPAIPPYLPGGLNLALWPAYIEYAFDTTRVAVNLIYHEILRDFPDIRWILAHAGGTFPYLATRLRLMEELETHQPPFRGLGAGRPFHQRFPEGVRPWLDRFHYDVALSGGGAPMAALTGLAGPRRILYGSDWPFVGHAFVADQIDDLAVMPHFAGDAFAAMAHCNAQRLFKRFSE
jgi:predicted TIM-barrel fold metal-dependent hydrolase